MDSGEVNALLEPRMAFSEGECRALSWQKGVFTIYNLDKSSPEGRLGPDAGEFAPVGIEGMVAQFEGERSSVHSSVETESTQPAGGWCRMMALKTDVLI
jgi:hypothetical protein